jgi:hypothetical protein
MPLVNPFTALYADRRLTYNGVQQYIKQGHEKFVTLFVTLFDVICENPAAAPTGQRF